MLGQAYAARVVVAGWALDAGADDEGLQVGFRLGGGACADAAGLVGS